jgi:hypothetical protein
MWRSAFGIAEVERSLIAVAGEGEDALHSWMVAAGAVVQIPGWDGSSEKGRTWKEKPDVRADNETLVFALGSLAADCTSGEAQIVVVLAAVDLYVLAAENMSLFEKMGLEGRARQVDPGGRDS